MLQRKNSLFWELLHHEIELHPHLYLVTLLSLSLLILSLGMNLNRDSQTVMNEAKETSQAAEYSTPNRTEAAATKVNLHPATPGKLNQRYLTADGKTIYLIGTMAKDFANVQIAFDNLPPGIVNGSCQTTATQILCPLSGTPTIPGIYYVTAHIKSIQNSNLTPEETVTFPFSIDL